MNGQHNEGFTDYMKCPKCGYMKLLKRTDNGYICRSCDRIEKEETGKK